MGCFYGVLLENLEMHVRMKNSTSFLFVGEDV